MVSCNFDTSETFGTPFLMGQKFIHLPQLKQLLLSGT
jgi:hypothetical protein